jgi:hypothetical protein
MKPKYRVGGFWRLLVALLCITLVVACGTIQVVHVHAHGDVSDAGCSLCATAHVAVQISNPPVIPVVVSVVARVEASAPLMRCRTLSIFALFTRPPPADAVLA